MLMNKDFVPFHGSARIRYNWAEYDIGLGAQKKQVGGETGRSG